MFVVWAYLLIWSNDYCLCGCTIVEAVLRHWVPKEEVCTVSCDVSRRPLQRPSTYG
jgi:hypothetical protein